MAHFEFMITVITLTTLLQAFRELSKTSPSVPQCSSALSCVKTRRRAATHPRSAAKVRLHVSTWQYSLLQQAHPCVQLVWPSIGCQLMFHCICVITRTVMCRQATMGQKREVAGDCNSSGVKPDSLDIIRDTAAAIRKMGKFLQAQLRVNEGTEYCLQSCLSHFLQQSSPTLFHCGVYVLSTMLAQLL